MRASIGYCVHGGEHSPCVVVTARREKVVQRWKGSGRRHWLQRSAPGPGMTLVGQGQPMANAPRLYMSDGPGLPPDPPPPPQPPHQRRQTN